MVRSKVDIFATHFAQLFRQSDIFVRKSPFYRGYYNPKKKKVIPLDRYCNTALSNFFYKKLPFIQINSNLNVSLPICLQKILYQLAELNYSSSSTEN